MGGARRLEHSVIRVKNLEQATKFYTQVMGLVEITRNDGIVYLGCGLDKNFDVGVVEGGTGLDHFAMRVDNQDELDLYTKRLKDNKVDYETLEKLEPGVKAGVRIILPSHTPMEFVAVSDNTYQRLNVAVLPSRSPVAPADADHLNILVPDTKAETEFFEKVLGFHVSDVIVAPNGSWTLTFVRMGDIQHDIAINAGLPEEQSVGRRLHHIAWNGVSFEHVRFMIDRVTSAGIPLEYGPQRQTVGNIATYFWEPGGNRFELSTEMPTIDKNSPTNYKGYNSDKSASWGIPITFRNGS